MLLRNIDRDVNCGLSQRFDQNTCLGPGAGAESDQFDVWSETRCDVGAISIQNVDLGSGDVIFRQLANFLEQRRAPLIVKIFAGKRARIAGKSGDHVREKIRDPAGKLTAVAVRVSCHYGIDRSARPAVAPYQDSLRIACESDPCELPAFFRLEEIAVGAANVSARRGAGTAAQNVLVAHEFAIVFAERAGRGAITGIRGVGAARPFPNVAKHLLKRDLDSTLR